MWSHTLHVSALVHPARCRTLGQVLCFSSLPMRVSSGEFPFFAVHGLSSLISKGRDAIALQYLLLQELESWHSGTAIRSVTVLLLEVSGSVSSTHSLVAHRPLTPAPKDLAPSCGHLRHCIHMHRSPQTTAYTPKEKKYLHSSQDS